MKNNFLQIPDYILSNQELDGDNKILLAKIIELHTRAGSCFMSNNTFGDFMGMSRTSISKRVTKLKSLGYIFTQDVWENKVQKGRIITPTFKRGSSQSSKGIVPKVNGGSSPSSKGVVPQVNTNIQPLINKETYKYTGSNSTSMYEFFKNKH